MQTLSHTSYLALRKDANVIEADGSGDKVLLLPDGCFLKLFRRKRIFTSAALRPYAQRFSNNTNLLRALDIPCPEVLGVYRISSIKRDGVHYKPLEGETIRHLTGDADQAQGLRAELGAFVARLHTKGVYFRSLHLGNIVSTPDHQLGLIDIADLKCERNALRATKRLRNFHHMLRYAGDRRWLLGDDKGETFLKSYESAMTPQESARLPMSRLIALFT